MNYVLTGSATADGRPLYRSAYGWSPRVSDACHFVADDRDGAVETARLEEFTICDPYTIAVEVDDDGPRPVSLRERIRAFGPTVGIPSR